MSSIQFTFPKYKLTAQLKAAGGMAVADALTAAKANLAELAPPCLTALQAATSEAVASFRAFPAQFSREALGELYAIAARAVGMGAICGLPNVDAAFSSLCDLVDHFSGSGRWDLAAIAVHISTLELFMAAGSTIDQAQAERLLSGLAKVSARYARRRTPEIDAS